MEKGESFEITIPIKCTMTKGSLSGTIMMCHGDVGGIVYDNGKKIGSIYGAIGGGIQISIDDITLAADMRDIFKRVYEKLTENHELSL